MAGEFEARLESVKKGGGVPIALSDYDVLGEELAIVRALADQLTLFAEVARPGQKNEIIGVRVDTLWGIGQAIKNLSGQVEDKIRMLDKAFTLTAREEGREGK